MRFALNRYQELVVASYDLPVDKFSCPNCNEPVFLRRGSHREAHFAHFAYTSPECENYHPSQGGIIQGRPGAIATKQDFPFWTRPQLMLNGNGANFQLSIALPCGGADLAEWTGRFLHATPVGIAHLARVDFLQGKSISVSPRLEKYVFSREGIVPETLWAMLIDGVPGLDQRTIFHCSDGAGRRLGRNEPLESDRLYWLILPERDLADGSALRFMRRSGSMGSWAVYELTIPSWETIANWSSLQRDHLESWFNHPFRQSSASIWVRHPLPRYFSGESWVYKCENLTLASNRELDEPPSVRSLDGRLLLPTSSGLTNRSWKFENVSEGFYSVHVGNRIALTFRILKDVVTLLKVESIRLRFGDDTASLFDSTGLLSRFQQAPPGSILNVELPPSYNINKLALRGVIRAENGGVTLVSPNDDIEIDADSYGFAHIPGQRSQLRPNHISPRPVIPAIIWLLSLPVPARNEPAIQFPSSKANETPLTRLLASRSWDARFAPHVYHVWNSIETGSAI